MASRARVVSVAFALCGFTVALVSGLAAGNQPGRVLLIALIALFVCQGIGTIVGAMLDRVVREHELQYTMSNPVPVVPSITSAGRTGIPVVGEVVDEQGATRASR